MNRFLPFVLMVLGCITWGWSSNGDTFHYKPTVLLSFIVIATFLSSKPSAFQKEIRIASLVMLGVFCFWGLKTIGNQFSGVFRFGDFAGGGLRIAGATWLFVINKTFLKEYFDFLKSKISKPN